MGDEVARRHFEGWDGPKRLGWARMEKIGSRRCQMQDLNAQMGWTMKMGWKNGVEMDARRWDLVSTLNCSLRFFNVAAENAMSHHDLLAWSVKSGLKLAISLRCLMGFLPLALLLCLFLGALGEGEAWYKLKREGYQRQWRLQAGPCSAGVPEPLIVQGHRPSPTGPVDPWHGLGLADVQQRLAQEHPIIWSQMQRRWQPHPKAFDVSPISSPVAEQVG